MSCLDINIKKEETIVSSYLKYRNSIKVGFSNKAAFYIDSVLTQLLHKKYNCCYKCETVPTCNNMCYTKTDRCVINITEYILSTCITPKNCIQITDVTNN